ncbi:MAG: helix-turn-helix transcriptional regulator [Clostridia bacterium]|nr:helix-turn-helix transcriptional regulator [Clostridia bacterium]
MSTRSTISSTVRHLLIEKGMKNQELATHMGISSSYLPRKINEERWTVDELDILAKIFELEPADFVRGYRYIRENHEFPSH